MSRTGRHSPIPMSALPSLPSPSASEAPRGTLFCLVGAFKVQVGPYRPPLEAFWQPQTVFGALGYLQSSEFSFFVSTFAQSPRQIDARSTSPTTLNPKPSTNFLLRAPQKKASEALALNTPRPRQHIVLFLRVDDQNPALPIIRNIP